jgi:hypothetical protein
MRRRSATCWERWCCRSWPATAHITAVRGDGVNPGLLGMERVVSEDAVRRALKKMPETDAEVWLRRHLDETTLPLLGIPWILDVDTTVKPLFGHQEGAGYNPHKPGRPSHTLHTYWVAGLRLVLDVEVKAGNEHASAHSAPALWGLLDRLGRWPWLLRGDADFGTERIMSRAGRSAVPVQVAQHAQRQAVDRESYGGGRLDRGWPGLAG